MFVNKKTFLSLCDTQNHVLCQIVYYISSSLIFCSSAGVNEEGMYNLIWCTEVDKCNH